MTNKLENIAKNVLKESGLPENQKFGSVIAVLMIISIILTIIRVIQECNKTESSSLSGSNKYGLYNREIKDLSVRQGWFTKMRIKKILRKELSAEDYKKYHMNILIGLLNSGEKLSLEDTQTLVEAANV